MKRSGGKARRPMGMWSVELQLVLAKLGYRRTQRAMELKELVKRLIDKSRRAKIAAIGPLFLDFE